MSSESTIRPILHFDFEHFTEDGEVQDISGNGYHGTIVGATRCEDMWGRANAAIYVESGIYIRFDDIQFNADSFAAFITFNVSVPTDNYGIGQLCGYYGSKYYNYIGIDFVNDRIDSEGDINGTNILINAGTSLGLENKYNNLGILRCDGLSYLVLNGEIIESQTPTADTITFNTIASRWSDVGVVGVFDEVKFYAQELTPTQAKKISFDMMRKIGRQ